MDDGATGSSAHRQTLYEAPKNESNSSVDDNSRPQLSLARDTISRDIGASLGTADHSKR